ncbi:Sodium/hydrogen exchanger family-domain-containing protein [Halteromyces radiatus]|uniref:Sodium/hydrogen exchanger family-domain-containing protein n=1 Tax=Halteromyces radiatus TaxID=101107 RepID=UPI002220900A|nr:Sodium/hydrogen exchanger family-domain-containing protein [Halteromyces radiatus]KAI8090020.1 Sodium/hydrogen exchanger family-domain-containing protein [Halteromyces radiatus]
MSDYIGSPNTEDPTADFLARERAALGEDADFFTDDHVAITPLPPGISSPSFLESPALPSPTGILSPSSATLNTEDLIQQSNQVSQFETSYPNPDELESSQAFQQAMLPDEEPETVRQWREKQNEILAERDQQAEKKRQEIIQQAHTDIDRFYEEYNEKKQQSIERNRQREEERQKEKDDLTTGTNIWERTLKEINNTRGSSKDSNVARMKEIMVELKKSKDAPGNLFAEMNANETDPSMPLPDEPMEEEMYSAWALLILMTLLIGALWASYYLQLRKIRAIHETVISIMAGMIVGLIIKLSPGTIIQKMMQFNQGYFFNLLLPPIILNSGYELKRRNFFFNFGTILTFAMVGTFIAAVVTGMLTFLFALLHLEGINISFLDSMIFGSILSATDPVTILAIFSQLHVDPQLFSIISGESLLNDAVAIVLSETLRKFRGQDLHAVNIFKGIGLFLGVFSASTFIGILFGIGVALMLKYSQLYRLPNIEACLISLMAYSSYLFSNAAQMSGIVTLLFTGITLKHYAYDNMSLRTKRATRYVFQILSQLSENFIFIYLGVNLFTQTELDYKPIFIMMTTVFICVARYLSVAPISFIINGICRAVGKPEILPRSHQLMLFWAGLRGAVAFALASSLSGESGSAMRTTILAVVVLTVLIFGGTTNRMLQVLEIKTGVVEPDDSCSEDEEDVDPQHWETRNNIRRRGRRRQLSISQRQQQNDQSRSSSQEHLLDMNGGNAIYDDDDDMDLEEEEDYMVNSSQRQYRQEQTDVSIGGLLSGPLGTPIPEPDQPHWFMSFDEKWLKPLLTKKHVQARNQTLAEYWREKRKKMERENQNMLAGIRGIQFRNNGYRQQEQDAMTLKSVHGTTGYDDGIQQQQQQQDTNEWEQQASDRSIFNTPSTNSKLVIGSGRVFGRSPSTPPDV